MTEPIVTPEPVGEPTQTLTQAQLDKIIVEKAEQIARTKFPDYDDLKATAAKWSAAEEASKTEVQKATDRAAAAEQKAVELERKVLAAKVAEIKGVPSELLVGSTEAELTEAADKLLAFAGTVTQGAKPDFLRLLGGGAAPGAVTLDGKEATAAAIRTLMAGRDK